MCSAKVVNMVEEVEAIDGHVESAVPFVDAQECL